MSNETLIIQAGLSERPRKSRLPARLDLLQSMTGLFLALFMWGHMFFVASILLGKDAMWTITKFFEGYFFFGKAYPGLVSIVVAVVAVVFVLHAMLAVRKFPINYRQFSVYRAHAKSMRHGDTTMWMWQVYTGFLMFFLASAHLYQMMVWPQAIGPYGSGGRMWVDGLWPFYLTLLLLVEFHGGIGLYRLAVKWCWPNAGREFLKKLKWGITAFFLILGLATLGAYIKIGIENQDKYLNGEHYTPAWVQQAEESAR
ncbi:MAG: fumarate reductase cytochrome b subunit [Proteobacteria bacterium]|nr:fumarate reductase cytochrome b subunit [Pseudomonadota bacterium]MCL2307064.1 fumarate reductase cytochrome b subunit [Pseudomonadota bacterium]